MEKTYLIRDYRLKNGLSCADLAAKLGIAEPTLRSIENGTRPVTAERALQFEQVTLGGLTRHDLRPDLFGVTRMVMAA